MELKQIKEQLRVKTQTIKLAALKREMKMMAMKIWLNELIVSKSNWLLTFTIPFLIFQRVKKFR